MAMMDTRKKWNQSQLNNASVTVSTASAKWQVTDSWKLDRLSVDNPYVDKK